MAVLLPLGSCARQQSKLYELRFGRNKSDLSEVQKQLLSRVADTLSGQRKFLVYINGHADNDADSSYNQRLSLRRSLVVKEFLIGAGIRDSVLIVQAMGEEQPLVANTTPLAKARNRRVEIFILFEQERWQDSIVVEPANNGPTCDGDTTVVLHEGYTLTLSKCDWENNQQCLWVEKRLRYKIKVKENWLKKHIGFKQYQKFIQTEPYYEFFVMSCNDSCFRQPLRLYIPQYEAPGLPTGKRFSQRRNSGGSQTGLQFRNTRLGDSAYYTAQIYCPGLLNCATDNRCQHPVSLYAGKNISLLSYSYREWNMNSVGSRIVQLTPTSDKLLTDTYTHTVFEELKFLYRGDTVVLENIPIDVFAHGRKKIITGRSPFEKTYFLFIPFRKKYKCGHYRKYKLRAKDIKKLKQLKAVGFYLMYG